MQLQHYARVIRRWLWLVLLGGIVCSSATFGISKFIIKPVYQASALLQVNGSPTASTNSNNDIYSDQALAISDALLITSSDTLQEVTKLVPGVSLSQLQRAVTASPQASTQIIEVRAQVSNPQLAADIANAVVSVFIQSQLGKVTTPLKKQDTQLSQDLLATKASIDQAKAHLTALQKSGASADEIAHQNDIISTYQANYNSLLANDRQVQSEENQASNALVVAQMAVPPNQPSSPQVLLNTIIAAALGGLLMLVLALLLDWLDTSIQTPEDVARLAQMEPLGSVPFSKHPLLLPNSANPSMASDDAIEQAFMVMSMSFSALNKRQCAVLVTGLRAGAGVTVTAVNLAIGFAQLGKRVLLVDANLRHPSLHEIFHCPNTKGLLNSLNDVHQMQYGIIPPWVNLWRTNIPNLWLMPTGQLATHPPIVQYLQELRVLTSWLQKKQNTGGRTPDAVDIIVFDATALSEGADTMALASVTDCSIVVVQAGKERNQAVSMAGKVLQRLGSPVLGVVVNRQTAKHRPYFYADDLRQNAMSVSVGGPSLEDILTSSLSTGQTFSPNTPPTVLQVNRRNNGLNRESLSPLDEDTHGLMEGIVPTTPSPLEQTRFNQFKILGPDHHSNEGRK